MTHTKIRRRNLAILKMLVEGATVREVAERFNLDRGTVTRIKREAKQRWEARQSAG